MNEVELGELGKLMQVQYTEERTMAEVCTIRTKVFVLCANQIVPWT